MKNVLNKSKDTLKWWENFWTLKLDAIPPRGPNRELWFMIAVYNCFSGKRVKNGILVAWPNCQVCILISAFILMFFCRVLDVVFIPEVKKWFMHEVLPLIYSISEDYVANSSNY